jgi:hypothetical protein
MNRAILLYKRKSKIGEPPSTGSFLDGGPTATFTGETREEIHKKIEAYTTERDIAC